MFIEKLEDKEILDFLQYSLFIFSKDLKDYGAVNRYGNAASVFITLKNGAVKIITLNDFNIATDNVVTDVKALKFQWKNFMYSKFGNEYKQAFNENLKKQYEDELIK